MLNCTQHKPFPSSWDTKEGETYIVEREINATWNEPAKAVPEYRAYQYDSGQVTACAVARPEVTASWECGDVIRNVGSDNNWTEIIVK